MKRGIRAVFGIVMSIILMLDMVPLPAFAEAEKTYINATEAVENPADYLFASQKDGTTKALFIDGAETAVEVSEEELTGIELWVQNANVTAPVTIGVRNFEISGNGSINTGAVVITPSNTIGSIISTTSTGSALTVVEHFTSEQFKGSEDSLGAVYSYEMIDNFEFSGWLAADSLSVAAGKKLTLNAFVEADSVIIDGELFIGASEDPEYPNGLNIKDGGSLEVKAGGSLTAKDGQILDICGGSTVTGITLYDCDGGTVYNNFEARELFFYDADNEKWVRENPGGGETPGGISENHYVVRYDANNSAAVTVNGEAVTDGDENEFTQGTELKFKLTPPEDCQDTTPIVGIIVFGESEEYYSTNLADDDPYKLSLVNNTVSFTPNSDAGIEVLVWWTEYDAFGGNEEKPVIVEFECFGNGTVTPENIANEDMIVYEQWTKVRVSADTESVTIRWEEGTTPSEIRAEGDLTLSAGDFVNNTCTIPLTPTMDHYYIRVDFGGNQGGGNTGGVPEKHYVVRYDANNSAAVTVNGEAVTDGDENEFTQGTELKFKLTPPEDCQDTTPIVGIIVFGESEEYYSTSLADNDPKHLSLVNNTVSFTPNSDAGIEVWVWWTEYDAFGGNGDKPIVVEFECCGDGTVTPEDIAAEDMIVNEQWTKIRVTEDTETVTISWEAGKAPSEIKAEGDLILDAEDFENNTCTIPLTPTMDYYYIRVEFNNGEEPGEDPGEGSDQPTGSVDRAIQEVQQREYAYYADLQQPETEQDSLKAYFTTELWWEFFGQVNGGNKRPYYGIFGETGETVSDELKTAVTLVRSSENDNVVGLPYYTYTIVFSESESATGKIYLLNGAKEFVVKTGNKYQVVDTSALSGENMDIYVSGNGEVSVFGNGVCNIGRLESGDNAIWAGSITQEHSGLGDDSVIGNIGCRLAVLPENYSGAKITGGVSAAAWGFASVPLFSAGTAGAASYAEIYYGNDGSDESRNFTISTIVDSRGINPYGNKAITNVALDTRYISDAVAEINPVENDFVLSFRSAYDEIPLVITYSDGSKGYVTIRRVGLHLSDTSVQNGTYDIWHGTDNIQNYSMDGTDEKAVTAAFYYATGDQMPEDTDRVSLSVTVTMTDGTVKRKMISAERRLNDTPIRTTGEDKYCDDFLVWSGTESEYDALDKIEVFAFVAGDSDSFGGVKVGSGAGVEWKPEE